MFTTMRALECYLALGMDTVYQSMFTDSRMSLSHKEMVTVSRARHLRAVNRIVNNAALCKLQSKSLILNLQWQV
jgi:hypothetical protein